MFFKKSKARSAPTSEPVERTPDASAGYVIACSGPDEYAATLLDLEGWIERVGGSCFPVLVAPGDAPRIRSYPDRPVEALPFERCDSFDALRDKDIDQLVALLSSHLTENRDDAVCVVLADDEASLFGVAHAFSTGKALRILSADDLDRTLTSGSNGSTTFVASLARVAELGLDRVSQSLGGNLSAAGLQRRREWGLMTGQNGFELSALIARQHLRSAAHTPRARIFWTGRSGPRLAATPELDVVDCRSIAPSAVAALAADPVPLLLFRGHGSPYCFYGGHICTGSREVDDRHVRCHGATHCVYEDHEPIIPADTFSCEVAVIDSCWSANLGDASPGGTNLVLTMLRTATAVVAPYRTNVMHPMSEFLLWDLLRRGMTLGEAVSITNALLSRELRILEPLILFGDPAARAFVGSDTYPKALRPREISDDDARFELPKAKESVESFYCDALPHPLGPRDHLHCLVSTSGDRHALAMTTPGVEDDRPSWLVVWLGDARPRTTSCLVTRSPAFDPSTLALAREVLRGWDELVGPGAFEGEDEPQDEADMGGADTPRWDLENTLCQSEPSLVGGVGLQTFTSTDYFKVREHGRLIEAQATAANVELLQSVVRAVGSENLATNYFAKTLGFQPLAHAHCEGKTCTHCGGSLQELEYRVGVRSPHVRHQIECENCGVLFDAREGMPAFRLEGPSHVECGRSCEYVLKGTYDGAVPAVVHAECRVRSPVASVDALDRIAVEPSAAESFLLPGDSVELRFGIAPADDAIAHYYRTKVFVCLNGALAIASRRILVC